MWMVEKDWRRKGKEEEAVIRINGNMCLLYLYFCILLWVGMV